MVNITFINGGIKMNKNKIVNYIMLLIISMAVTISFTGCSHHLKQVKNIMWKASKGANTVYLVGTIHGVPAGYKLVSNKLNSIIKKTDGLAVEINVSDQGKMIKIQNELQIKTKLENGSIEDYLSIQDIKKLKILLSDFGINYEDVKNDSSYGILSSVSSSIYKSIGITQPGLDFILISTYLKSGKTICDLEEADSRIDIAEKAYTIDILKQFISEYHQGDSQKIINDSKKTFQLYVNGDLNFYNVSGSELISFVNYGDNYNILLKDRNINMAKKIDGLASSGKKYLVAVGEAHFATGDSIINYLENMGYKVEAIPD